MIHLRELTATDVGRVNGWRRDKGLAENLGQAFRFVNIETDSAWFESYLSQRHNTIRLAICLDGDGAHIGNVYLLNIDWIARSAIFHIFIGAKEHRRKGYGKRATQLCLDHAFQDCNLHRVSLSVLSTNLPAISLYERCGFQREGIAREAAFKHGHYVDMLMMAVRNDARDS